MSPSRCPLFAHIFFIAFLFFIWTVWLFFLYTLSLLYLKATKIWEYRQHWKKNQFSFCAHRLRLAHKKHSLFSFFHSKNCISYSNASVGVSFGLSCDNSWQAKPCVDLLRRTHSTIKFDNIFFFFFSPWFCPRFLRSFSTICYLIFMESYFTKWINRCICAALQVGIRNVIEQADTCNWRQKPLQIELFLLSKEFYMITMNTDSNSGTKKKKQIKSNDDTWSADWIWFLKLNILWLLLTENIIEDRKIINWKSLSESYILHPKCFLHF